MQNCSLRVARPGTIFCRSDLKGDPEYSGATVMDFGYGIGGLIVLALDIWAIASIVQSGAPSGTKVVWILVIVLLPLIGF
ncbi:MAG: PLD nuclease N-terminal domain-containing protein, partial [Acidobacteriota bacterium]